MCLPMHQLTRWAQPRSIADPLPLPLGGRSDHCSSGPTGFDKFAEKVVALAILQNDCCRVVSRYLNLK